MQLCLCFQRIFYNRLIIVRPVEAAGIQIDFQHGASRIFSALQDKQRKGICPARLMPLRVIPSGVGDYRIYDNKNRVSLQEARKAVAAAGRRWGG